MSDAPPTTPVAPGHSRAERVIRFDELHNGTALAANHGGAGDDADVMRAVAALQLSVYAYAYKTIPPMVRKSEFDRLVAHLGPTFLFLDQEGCRAGRAVDRLDRMVLCLSPLVPHDPDPAARAYRLHVAPATLLFLYRQFEPAVEPTHALTQTPVAS